MTRTRFVSGLLLLFIASGGPALAQEPQLPPGAIGLFGAAIPAAGVRESLTFTASLAEAYDDDIYQDLRPTVELLAPQARGYYTMLVASGGYLKRGRRAQLVLTGNTALRYYRDFGDVVALSHVAIAAFSAEVAQHTTLSVQQSASYSPSYLYVLFPALAPPGLGENVTPSPDYAASDVEAYSHHTVAKLTRGLSPRNSVTASAEFRYLDYLHENVRLRDGTIRGVGGEFIRGISPSASLNARYHYRAGDLTYTVVPATTTEHGLDVGFLYTRPYASERSVDLTALLGVVSIDVPEASDNPAILGHHLTMTGQLGATYRLARAWSVAGAYRRGVDYLGELSQPVEMHGASAMVNGLFTPRLEFLASARYATGESALNRGGMFFDTYAGDVRVRYGLTRTLAAYVEYLYYYYDFRRSELLPPGIPGSLERQGVRVGITVWVPALQR